LPVLHPLVGQWWDKIHHIKLSFLKDSSRQPDCHANGPTHHGDLIDPQHILPVIRSSKQFVTMATMTHHQCSGIVVRNDELQSVRRL